MAQELGKITELSGIVMIDGAPAQVGDSVFEGQVIQTVGPFSSVAVAGTNCTFKLAGNESMSLDKTTLRANGINADDFRVAEESVQKAVEEVSKEASEEEASIDFNNLESTAAGAQGDVGTNTNETTANPLNQQESVSNPFGTSTPVDTNFNNTLGDQVTSQITPPTTPTGAARSLDELDPLSQVGAGAQADTPTDTEGTTQPEAPSGGGGEEVAQGTGNEASGADDVVETDDGTTGENDNDNTATISILAGDDVIEGDKAQFTLTLDNAPNAQMSVEIELSNGSTITQSIAAESWTESDGKYTYNLEIDTVDDGLVESGENLSATIKSASGGEFESLVVSQEPASVNIIDNDVATITIDATSSGKEHIVNGSFELNAQGVAQAAPSGNYYSASGLQGWTLVSGSTMEVVSGTHKMSNQSGSSALDTTDGSNYLDMEASPVNIAVKQDITGLAEGAKLILSFDAADKALADPNFGGWSQPSGTKGTDSTVLEVYWNGEKIGVVNTDTAGWQHFKAEVTASGTGSDTVMFKEIGYQGDYHGTALDNVSLTTESLNVSGTTSGVQEGGSVNILVDGVIYSTTVDANGDYKIENLDVTGKSGDIAVSATTIDVIGNEISTNTNVVLATDAGADIRTLADTTDVSGPTVTMNDIVVTKDSTPTITGSVDDPSASVIVKIGGKDYVATVANDGTWSLDGNKLTSVLTDGTTNVTVTAIDHAGNKGTDSGVIKVDTIAAPPSITNIADESAAGDYSKVTMYGTGEVGATINIYALSGTYSSDAASNNGASGTYASVGTAIVQSNGTWTFDISQLSTTSVNDNEFFKASQTDAAGNTSAYTSPVHYWHGNWASATTEAGDDYILMGGGNDTLYANSNDANNKLVIDGGAGNDTVIFGMNHTAVTASGTDEAITIIEGGDTNVLVGVETVQFNDGHYYKDENGVLQFDNKPVASAKVFEASEDTSITITKAQLLAGATDADGDTLSIAGVSLVSGVHGTLTTNNDGSYTFTPSANYSGNAIELNFTVSDGKGETSTASAKINVAAVADTANVSLTVTEVATTKDYIVNGSFEDASGTKVTGNSGNTLTTSTVTDKNIGDGDWIAMKEIPGWKMMDNSARWMELHEGKHASVGTKDGSNYMDLGESIGHFGTAGTQTGYNGNIHIGQTISGLLEGQEMTLSFSYNDKAKIQENNASGKMEVLWNGSVVATIEGNNTTWQDYTHGNKLIAVAGDNILSFKEIGEGNDNWGMAIDAVKLEGTTYTYTATATGSVNDSSESLALSIDGLPDGTRTTTNSDGSVSTTFTTGQQLDAGDIKAVAITTDGADTTTVEADVNGNMTLVLDNEPIIDFDIVAANSHNIDTVKVDDATQTIENISANDIIDMTGGANQINLDVEGSTTIETTADLSVTPASDAATVTTQATTPATEVAVITDVVTIKIDDTHTA